MFSFRFSLEFRLKRKVKNLCGCFGCVDSCGFYVFAIVRECSTTFNLFERSSLAAIWNCLFFRYGGQWPKQTNKVETEPNMFSCSSCRKCRKKMAELKSPICDNLNERSDYTGGTGMSDRGSHLISMSRKLKGRRIDKHKKCSVHDLKVQFSGGRCFNMGYK